jgi:hypothetical protein
MLVALTVLIGVTTVGVALLWYELRGIREAVRPASPPVAPVPPVAAPGE